MEQRSCKVVLAEGALKWDNLRIKQRYLHKFYKYGE